MRNPVVITGDWHSTFVNDIKADFSDPDSATVATEFVGTSISSNGDGIIYGPYYGPMVPANPTMVSTVSRSDAPVSTFASFAVDDGTPGAREV